MQHFGDFGVHEPAMNNNEDIPDYDYLIINSEDIIMKII